MKREELLRQAKRIAAMFEAVRSEDGYNAFVAARLQATEFMKAAAGPDSAFFVALKDLSGRFADISAKNAVAILNSFCLFVEEGLHQALSPEEEAQLEVVTDLLDQSRHLVSDSKLHPAAAIVIAGATLEEFLRTWATRESVLPAGRPTLSGLANALRTKNAISKQDEKDITSWAGLRNSAAHGDWDEVSDRSRAKLMVEGVALFLRQHSDLT